MDWILANPDFVPDPSDVPESEQSGEPSSAPSSLIGGDQDTPVVAAPERTPEEKAKAAKELQERLDKARDIRIEKEKQEKIQKEKDRREQVLCPTGKFESERSFKGLLRVKQWVQ